MEWLDINSAPKNGIFLTGLDRGLFGGGWTWYKTKTLNNKFFNYDTGERISPTHWALPEPPKNECKHGESLSGCCNACADSGKDPRNGHYIGLDRNKTS